MGRHRRVSDTRLARRSLCWGNGEDEPFSRRLAARRVGAWRTSILRYLASGRCSAASACRGREGRRENRQVDRIDQIEIVESTPSIERLRLKMIELEFTRDVIPSLTFQAIDATKVKLVAKPRAVALIERIPRRAVASLFAWVGVVENQLGLSSAASANSFRCKAFAPAVGRFASESSRSRMILVRPASSIRSAGVNVSWISLSINSNRR